MIRLVRPTARELLAGHRLMLTSPGMRARCSCGWVGARVREYPVEARRDWSGHLAAVLRSA